MRDLEFQVVYRYQLQVRVRGGSWRDVGAAARSVAEATSSFEAERRTTQDLPVLRPQATPATDVEIVILDPE